jgi:hypothetical protein
MMGKILLAPIKKIFFSAAGTSSEVVMEQVE